MTWKIINEKICSYNWSQCFWQKVVHKLGHIAKETLFEWRAFHYTEAPALLLSENRGTLLLKAIIKYSFNKNDLLLSSEAYTLVLRWLNFHNTRNQWIYRAIIRGSVFHVVASPNNTHDNASSTPYLISAPTVCIYLLFRFLSSSCALTIVSWTASPLSCPISLLHCASLYRLFREI